MNRETPRGTVTILFTDVVGSTALTTARGDAPAHEIMRGQRALVRREIERHAGHEVKTMGDGFMVVFDSARQAVNCAVAIQQALERLAQERPGDAVGLRVGLNTGEAIADEEDFFGAAVTAAERVMGKASGGQILVAESVRAVLGQASDVRFADRGRFRLKGFPERVRLYEVIWREAAVPAPQTLGRSRFVSRTRELGLLRSALDEAAGGHGSMALIAGQPGVGKTRLAEEIAEEARRRGFMCFTGRCYEDGGGTPYAPFVEMLDAVARSVPRSALQAAFGDSLADVARVAPAIRDAFPDLQQPLEQPATNAQRQIFHGIRDFLARSARARPLLLVLDDLHWADEPTLRLLRQIVRAAPEMPALVVATFRDGPQDVDSPLSQALDEWHRNHLAARIALHPFTADEVAALLRTLNGQPAPEGFARALHNETGGNAFFLEELLQHLAEERPLFDDRGAWRGDLRIDSLPTGVRVVVDRRIRRLGKGAHDMLAAGAVLGQAFEAEVLERVLAISYDSLLDLVEPVERAGILVPEDERETSWRFAHSLTRTVLLDSLSSGQKQRLHLAAADALSELPGRMPDRAPDLARHLLASGRLAERPRTIDALRTAGDRALQSFAHREAAEYFRTALELDRKSVLTAEDRAGLLHEYGRTLYLLGRLDDSRAVLDGAGAEYERLGDAGHYAEVLFSKAALSTYDGRAADAVELLESAKPFASDDAALTVLMLQLEAQNLVQLRQYPRASEVVEDALASAERLGDPYQVAQARLAAGYLALSTLQMPRAAEEFAFVVGAAGNTHRQMAAESRRAIALACVGELSEAALRSMAAVAYFRHMAEAGVATPDERDPYESSIASLAASLPAIARGAFDDALATLAEALAEAGTPPSAGVVRMLLPLIVQAHHAAGRFDEAEDCIAHYLPAGEGGAQRSVFARIYSVVSSAARGAPAREDLPPPPAHAPDLQSLPVSVLAAEAAVATDDMKAAERQVVAIRHLHEAGMVFTTGWVALVPRLLGALYRLCGDLALAGRCLDSAMKTALATGAHPEVALTHLEMAWLAAARGPEHARAARTHLAEARRLLTECGIRAHDRRLAALSALIGGPVEADGALTAEERDLLRMVAMGLSNQRIALDREVSVHTVQRRLGQLYRKIGVENRGGATAYAYRNGIARDGA